MDNLEGPLFLVPEDPVDEDPGAVEVDETHGHEERVPVELLVRGGGSGETPQVVARPDGHQHHHA